MHTMPSHAYLLIVLLIVAADRWTKVLVIDHLTYLNYMDITPYLSIVHARNYGGAFGFLSQHGAAAYIFLVLPIIIIAGLLYYLLRYQHTGTVKFSLTCILAGALGNMYDRLRYGYVTDFIDCLLQAVPLARLQHCGYVNNLRDRALDIYAAVSRRRRLKAM